MNLYNKLKAFLESNDGHPPESYEMPSKWIIPKAKRGGYKVGDTVPKVMDDYNGWGRNFERSKSDKSTARLMRDYKGPVYKDPDNELDPIGNHEKKYLSSKMNQDNKRNIRIVK